MQYIMLSELPLCYNGNEERNFNSSNPDLAFRLTTCLFLHQSDRGIRVFTVSFVFIYRPLGLTFIEEQVFSGLERHISPYGLLTYGRFPITSLRGPHPHSIVWAVQRQATRNPKSIEHWAQSLNMKWASRGSGWLGLRPMITMGKACIPRQLWTPQDTQTLMYTHTRKPVWCAILGVLLCAFTHARNSPHSRVRRHTRTHWKYTGENCDTSDCVGSFFSIERVYVCDYGESDTFLLIFSSFIYSLLFRINCRKFDV